MSTRGGVWRALERGVEITCESVQLFVKNNLQWFGKPYSAQDLARYESERATRSFSAVFGHAGYLINLAGPPSAIRDKSIQSLIHEIELAASLGLPFLVMHPGAHIGQGEAKGLAQIVAGLDEVFTTTRRSRVRIALENTAGQGSCLGYRFEHLAAIYGAVKKPERLAVCLDTAHLFAAGYDIRTARGWHSAMDEVGALIGLEQVVAFHLNDSKTDFNSRVDRHDHIGKGKIGQEAFRHVINDARFGGLPGCLETPKSDDHHEDLANLAVLRSLLEIPPGRRRGSKRLRALR